MKDRCIHAVYVTDASGAAIQHLEIDRREIREPPLKLQQGREQYMAFGEVFVDQRRTGFGTPYKFNAKELDCESGYYYYGARYYDPRMARFLSVDPLAGEFPSWTSYHYVHNNPLRYIDPTGMGAEECPTCPNNAEEGATHEWGGATFTYGENGGWANTLPEIAVSDSRPNKGTIANRSFASDVLENLVEVPIDAFLNVSTSIGGHLIDRAGIVLEEGLHEGPAYNGENDLSLPRLRFDFENPNWIYMEENIETNKHTKEIAKDQVKVLTSIPVGGLYGIPIKFGVNFLIQKSLEQKAQKEFKKP